MFAIPKSNCMKKDDYKIRIVCATSLYDGHDAAINIMRRIMQQKGAEVIHLGHNRSAEEIIRCAIQEDAQGIAVTSYQGGHLEFYTYMYDLLKEQDCHIKITGGGGGTILPEEAEKLHSYGIDRIYSPEDGRIMGLEGMVDDLLKICSFNTLDEFNPDVQELEGLFHDKRIAKWLSWLESQAASNKEITDFLSEKARHKKVPVIGITGTGGAGKSSLTDELIRRFYTQHPGIRIAILSADPSKRKGGGALLGDRIRINMASSPGIFMRSMATRGSSGALSKASSSATDLLKMTGFDVIILESSGIGQSGSEITDLSDLSLYVMTPEYGAASQLAFTLANAFTYVEYYRSRGMHVDDFAPNLSFFFSNGLDAEYAVLGRVARKIWAVTMRYLYKGTARSQKLKYHIQTSGRSLHAKEMDFNDIRTTLQALYALNDNCNSLHTNAYDEAITTPTESSVRRALAIQLIIDKEMGLYKNENMLQGSFIIEELTRLVEEAVFKEFERINNRGGVLPAMERMYQRSKIQEESLLYEQKKQDGSLPLVGINTFMRESDADEIISPKVIRATDAEKQLAIKNLHRFQESHKNESTDSLRSLRASVMNGSNTFNELMQTVKYCSLGEITQALYETGGQYRRNM